VFPSVVHTIKTLYIFVWENSVDMVLSFLSCFPCLEKLYIEVIMYLWFLVLTAKHIPYLYVFLCSAMWALTKIFVAP
jgi:hypothetical protein